MQQHTVMRSTGEIARSYYVECKETKQDGGQPEEYEEETSVAAT